MLADVWSSRATWWGDRLANEALYAGIEALAQHYDFENSRDHSEFFPDERPGRFEMAARLDKNKIRSRLVRWFTLTYELHRASTPKFDAAEISFSFVSAGGNIALRHNRAPGEGIDVAKPRWSNAEKHRLVLDATASAGPTSADTDARLVALVLLLARHAAREFVETEWLGRTRDDLPE